MGKKGTRKNTRTKKGGNFFEGITTFANKVMTGAEDLGNTITTKAKSLTTKKDASVVPEQAPAPAAQQAQPAQQAPAAQQAQPAAAKPITDPRTLTNETILVGGKRKHRRSRKTRKSRKSRKSKSKKHRRRKTKKRRCNCPCKKC